MVLGSSWLFLWLLLNSALPNNYRDGNKATFWSELVRDWLRGLFFANKFAPAINSKVTTSESTAFLCALCVFSALTASFFISKQASTSYNFVAICK